MKGTSHFKKCQGKNYYFIERGVKVRGSLLQGLEHFPKCEIYEHESATWSYLHYTSTHEISELNVALLIIY